MSDSDCSEGRECDEGVIPADEHEAYEMPLDDGFELLLTLEDETLLERAIRLGLAGQERPNESSLIK